MSWNSNDGIECAQASGAYFGSMIGTIYAAMVLRIYLLVIFFIGVQMVALTWYSLSYIPYGRQPFQRFILPVLKPVIKVVSASGAYFGSMIGTIYAAMVLRIYLLLLTSS